MLNVPYPSCIMFHVQCAVTAGILDKLATYCCTCIYAGLSLDPIQWHSSSWFWKPESRGELSYPKLEGPTNDFPLARLVYMILYYLWDTRPRDFIPTTNRRLIVSPLDSDACDSTHMCTHAQSHPLTHHKTPKSHVFHLEKLTMYLRAQLCDYCVRLTTKAVQPTTEERRKSNAIIVQYRRLVHGAVTFSGSSEKLWNIWTSAVISHSIVKHRGCSVLRSWWNWSSARDSGRVCVCLCACLKAGWCFNMCVFFLCATLVSVCMFPVRACVHMQKCICMHAEFRRALYTHMRVKSEMCLFHRNSHTHIHTQVWVLYLCCTFIDVSY